MKGVVIVMRQKISVAIDFGGRLDQFEIKGYEYTNQGVVVITEFDGTKILLSPTNVMIEVTNVDD